MSPKALLWRALGAAFFLIGLIGIALPVLPTVPFWLVAAWAFGKGNPAWRDRLLAHPKYGPSLRLWGRYRAISPRAKRAAMLGLAASLLLSVWLMPDRPWVLAAVAVCLLASAVFILTRPEPTPAQLDSLERPVHSKAASERGC